MITPLWSRLRAGYWPKIGGFAIIDSAPSGEVGVSYVWNFTAIGGTGALTWSISDGFIPTGLNFISGGLLSGIPTVADSFTFTVRVEDELPSSVEREMTVVINPADTGEDRVVMSATGIAIRRDA